MKKTMKLALLVCLALLACALVFTACDSHVHTFGEWIVDKDATVKEDGTKHQICSVCKEILMTETIPATGSQGLSYTVNIDGTTCTITGIGTCTDTELYIGRSIDGYEVTAIGDKALAECTSFTKVFLSDSVKSINRRAFYKCTELTEITIPASVTDIGQQIFYGCDNLTTVYYNSEYGNAENPFLNVASIKTVVFGGSKVPNNILCNSKSVTSIVILDSVTSIDHHAFYHCDGITEVTIPDSVTSIGYYAFSSCDNLTSITIPDSVAVIGDSAFYHCEELNTLTFGSGLTVLGIEAFDACKKLEDVYITNVESWLLLDRFNYLDLPIYQGNLHLLDEDGKEITELTIPDSMMCISYYSLCNCKELTSVIIPDSVTVIEEKTFINCENLVSITIPDSVTKIGYHAFKGCGNLTKITFQGTIEEWNAIEKGIIWEQNLDWDEGTGNYTVYCTDGEITKN